MSEKPKNKPPAFQFYADDFLAGTLDLSQAEVGAYIRLLCHQWNRGSIPVETEKQQRLAGGSVSVDVLAKFRLRPDGTLANERLEVERQKQTEFREKQREKGKASAKSRSNQQRFNRGSTAVQPNPQPEGQPEGNSPSPSPSPIIVNTHTAHARASGIWPTMEEVKDSASMQAIPEAVAEAFWHHYEAQGWQTKDGLQIVKWQSKLTSWWRNEQAAKAKQHGHQNRSSGHHGQTEADRRRSLVAGADAVQRQAERTAAREREMVERGELPL